MNIKKQSVKNHFHRRISAGHLVIVIVLTLLTGLFLFPFWNAYVYAFNDGVDSARGGLYLWPRIFTINNIIAAFTTENLTGAFLISVFRTVVGTATHLLCTSLLGYALSKKKMPGHSVLTFYFFITMLFSGGMIPFFILLKELNLINNILVYVVPGLYSFWNAIIFRSFFDTIPSSIEESAEMDGASVLRIFFRLILPLSGPVFATIGLFTAIGHWNDWFSGTFYVNRIKLQPLQTVLQRMITELDVMKDLGRSGQTENIARLTRSITPNSIRYAVLVITVTPIIMIYPFVQKYFVKGIMLGAVKG